MCRKLAFAATAVALIVGGPALAKAKPEPPQPVASTRVSADERAMAERSDPVTRATFWAHQVELDSRDAEAGVKFASALRALGRYTEAAQAARQVSIVDPSNVEALLETARAYIGGNQGFFAIEPAEKARALDPRDWRAPSLLGVAYEQSQRDDEALAAYNLALALSPENPSVLANLGLFHVRKGSPATAEPLLRRAAAAPGATAQVRQNLAYVLGLQGKLAEAEALMRRDLPPEQVAGNLALLKAAAPLAGNGG